MIAARRLRPTIVFVSLISSASDPSVTAVLWIPVASKLGSASSAGNGIERRAAPSSEVVELHVVRRTVANRPAISAGRVRGSGCEQRSIACLTAPGEMLTVIIVGLETVD